VSVGVILIALLLLVGVFLASSLALSRATHEVGSARGDEYLELEGHWIRYGVSGGGPPVVLVHGWLQSSRTWERLAHRLEGRFTVYSLDLAGFGESDKPISGYGVRYGSRLLYAFCAHFGLTKAAIVGQDLGGAVALKLAADHPDVVGRIVLVATPANEEQIDLPTPLWFATLPVLGPVVYSLGRRIGPVRRMWMRPFVLERGSLSDEVVEDAGRSTPAAISKSLSVMRREISRGRLARQAGVIKTPVLAIAGEEDEIVDPQGTANWADALGAEVVLLNDCGHLPQLERPREFDAQVLAFLTGDASYLESLSEEAPSVPADEMHPDDETRPIEPSPSTGSSGASASERPRVFRKRPGGQDDGLRREASVGDSGGDGPASRRGPRADRGGPAPSSNGVERRRVRRLEEDGGETEARSPLPEMPRDLFEWPAAWKEFHPGEAADRGTERESSDERRAAGREEGREEPGGEPDGSGPGRS
jgi:pimeloyl-ACP methyl ester carboxylesterase